MLLFSFSAFVAILLAADAVPTPSKDGVQIPGLPENWDQTKEDTQSLFLNKSDKNDLEPYPLALSDEGNGDAYEVAVDQRGYEVQQSPDFDNLIMRPEFYGEPPSMENSGRYDNRRKRGSGTKVGGAGAATKVATKKESSGKKNLRPANRMELLSLRSDIMETRRKRGSGTKVAGAATKVATKSGSGSGSSSGKKNLRPLTEQSRQKRDSGLSAGDVRGLLTLWEAQRRQAEMDNKMAAERYYNQINTLEDDQAEVDENGDIWYNEPDMIGSREHHMYPRHSYFSEQNRMPIARDAFYHINGDTARRLEEASRKRQYGNMVKRFMVTRKRSDGAAMQQNYRPRDDLYTLAELLRSAPRVEERNIPYYRQLIL